MVREWVGALNRDIEGYEGYTPFIDSLMQHSYYFENAYAEGLKSIDAMPNLLASQQYSERMRHNRLVVSD